MTSPSPAGLLEEPWRPVFLLRFAVFTRREASELKMRWRRRSWRAELGPDGWVNGHLVPDAQCFLNQSPLGRFDSCRGSFSLLSLFETTHALWRSDTLTGVKGPISAVGMFPLRPAQWQVSVFSGHGN